MVEYLALGRVLQSEQHVLKAVKFSDSLKDSFQVNVDKDSVSKLFVSFDLGSGETLMKKVDTYKEANDWLISMSESTKSGALTSGIRKIQRETKPTVELEKAADSLMVSDALPAGQLAATGSDSKPIVAAPGSMDVTANFLATTQTQQVAALPPSSVCVHKGSLKTFLSMTYRNPAVYGVLFGKKAWNGKFHVTNIILSEDPERSPTRMLEDERVAATLRSISVECCGLVVAGDYEHWAQTKNQENILKEISCEPNPLFVLVHFGNKVNGEVSSWELCKETGDVKATSLSHTTQCHDVTKRLTYNICGVQDLGVSHLEYATKRLCSAILNQILEQETQNGPPCHAREVPFRKIGVPGDGYCGWYCLLASENISGWEGIQRNEGFYAINHHVQKQEERNAQHLHRAVCERALQICDKSYHAAIRSVLGNPNFSPSDLEWIGFVCSVTIRCSCDPKAVWFKIHSWY